MRSNRLTSATVCIVLVKIASAAALTSSPAPAAERPPSMESSRVAILGSGVAGSTAARLLAESGASVTVFEAGYGVGGRTSTRTTRDGDSLAFDHGAQYIGPPKTEEFARALEGWRAGGFVREWRGRFAEVVGAISPGPETTATTATSTTTRIIAEDPRSVENPRYVGYPSMNSICSNLLEHDNIDVVTRTRACASFDESSSSSPSMPRWSLTSHSDGRDLGRYDWLVGTDRLSATNGRADLRDAPVSEFADLVGPVESIPILALMVAFESPLRGVPFDGIKFTDGGKGGGGFGGSLGWIARDTSKPGRKRLDGKECWVIQSHLSAASEVISSAGRDAGEDYEAKRELVRERAKELLLTDFLRVIPELSRDKEATDIPNVIHSVGHRWSAAFPLLPPEGAGGDCYSDAEHNFIACGDYMGTRTGRVEGSFLSGRAAAFTLMDEVGTRGELK